MISTSHKGNRKMYDNEDDAREATVSAKQAKYEIEINHSVADGFVDFVAEYGQHPTYNGGDVLDWLGY
jgi:hypothetical protein